MNHAKEHEELGPRAVALVHRVWKERGVFAKALVQAGERVVLQERLVLGQHVALLGVEQKHEPEDHSKERAVDFVGVLSERLSQELTTRGIVRRLKATKQFVECVQHLLGQALADFVLEFAAVVRGAPQGAARGAGSEVAAD